MKKEIRIGVGSGTGSISQRYGSGDPDPDPHQNVTDPQRWPGQTAVCIFYYLYLCVSGQREDSSRNTAGSRRGGYPSRNVN